MHGVRRAHAQVVESRYSYERSGWRSVANASLSAAMVHRSRIMVRASRPPTWHSEAMAYSRPGLDIDHGTVDASTSTRSRLEIFTYGHCVRRSTSIDPDRDLHEGATSYCGRANESLTVEIVLSSLPTAARSLPTSSSMASCLWSSMALGSWGISAMEHAEGNTFETASGGQDAIGRHGY